LATVGEEILQVYFSDQGFVFHFNVPTLRRTGFATPSVTFPNSHVRKI
jgi:hypothetical protein